MLEQMFDGNVQAGMDKLGQVATLNRVGQPREAARDEVRGVLAISMLAANEWQLVELDGQLRTVLSVVKMRGSAHSRDFREYTVTPRGAVNPCALLGPAFDAGSLARLPIVVFLRPMRFDFDNQRMVRLPSPVDVDPGDTLRVTCTHDASLRAQVPQLSKLPPRYVVWGDGTGDEMCIGIMTVSPRKS